MHGPERNALQYTRRRRDCSTWNIWGDVDEGLEGAGADAGIDPLCPARPAPTSQQLKCSTRSLAVRIPFIRGPKPNVLDTPDAAEIVSQGTLEQSSEVKPRGPPGALS